MKSVLTYIVIFLLIASFQSYSQTDDNLTKQEEHIIPNKDSIDAEIKQKLLKNPVGKEFWLCFQRNYKETGNSSSDKLFLELFLTGDYDANVKIEIPGLHFRLDTIVPAETVINVKIPSVAQLLTSESHEQLSIHIIASSPISVYGLNRRFQTTDTYLGLPIEVLGNEYRTMCFDESEGLVSQVAFIATENGTRVSVVPSANTLKHPRGMEFSVNMRKGDVYQIIAKFEPFSTCDLTGTYIKSNKKIAVFSGHQCSYVPDNIIACNHLVEQLPPLPSWGRHFYLGNFHSRRRYTYRVLAHHDSTKIFENNKMLKMLKAGEYFTKIDDRNLQLTASRPVLVSQYSHGFSDGDSIGDPMMILVSPTQQFLKSYRFATPINGSWNHFINVVVPTNSINTLRLDGNYISSSDFEKIGLSRYSIGHIKIPFGTHLITGESPFGMYSYGFGFKGNMKDDAYDAYGTMGGQSFIEYEIELDTLPPNADINEGQDTSEIIVRDDRIDDSGLREVRVLENYGIDFDIDNITLGTPQAALRVQPTMPEIAGKLILETIDVALNKSIFTVCYHFDTENNRFTFTLSEGVEESCEVDPGIQLGAYGFVSANANFPEFSRTGNIIANGDFGETFNFGGFGGLFVGRHLQPDMILSARLSFEDNSADLKAPDSLISNVRDTETGELRPFQEETNLLVNAKYMNLSFAYEYYLKNRIYFFGGLNFSIALSNTSELRKRIIIPEDFAYASGKKEIVITNVDELTSITNFRFGIFGGLGFNYNINYNLSIFSETYYQHYFNDVVDDRDWYLAQMKFQFGLRYRFFFFK